MQASRSSRQHTRRRFIKWAFGAVLLSFTVSQLSPMVWDWTIYDFVIGDIHGLAANGEQMWATEVIRATEGMENETFDKCRLAERLARDYEPVTASQGLIMLVRYNDPRAGPILEAHADDARTNAYLMSNGEVARACLRVLALKHQRLRTLEEDAFVEKWTSHGPKP